VTLPLWRPEALARFDLLGDLPRGTTLLEASAGTGKTYTIAALATRYVAEGLAELPELLMVTFGRAATSELRDRVRERLVGVHAALAARTGPDSGDPLVAHLVAAGEAEMSARRARLARALATFDQATIATTHGFCQQMLARLGILADLDADAVMVGDVADLVTEVVQDVYLQRYATADRAVLSPTQVADLGRAAVGDPLARLEPAAAHPESLPGHRYATTRAVLREVVRRKRERRLLDYDDLLDRLAAALRHPTLGARAAGRIRERYRVVLVDEFQDTDPVQWEILRTAFHGHRTMVLIGDPKQAIYAFRGGDVVTYLSAADAADATATLDRNRRSDAPLLDAVHHLLGEAALGDPRIVVRPASAHHQTARCDAPAALRLRHVHRGVFSVRGTATPRVGDVRDLIAEDVAVDLVGALAQRRLATARGWRPLEPGDVAVLTRTNAEALRVQAALVGSGVPAVVSGVSSVFGSEAARMWLTLLDALEHPGHSGRAAALALTDIVGWDAARLAGADERGRDELADLARGWARLLAARGVGALLEAVTATGLLERLAARPDGERRLTDLRHVAQVLHEVSVRRQAAVSALAVYLRARIAEASGDYAEERSRRLETDRAAVQVLTVHASKGLEFPVVYVPFAWDRFEPDEPEVLRFHDGAGNRVLHVGGPTSDHYAPARDRHRGEERGEDLRLLYVALTRACSQVVLWWAPSRNSIGGALSRVLLGGHGPGEQPPATVRLGRDEEIAAAFEAVAAGSGGTVVVESVAERPVPARRAGGAAPFADLVAARWDRMLDDGWRRLSFTALTAASTAHGTDPRPSSEPEDAGVLDEQDTAAPVTGEADSSPADQPGCLLGDLPAGAGFGTLVHEVLELLDPTAGDLAGQVRRLAVQRGASSVLGVGSRPGSGSGSGIDDALAALGDGTAAALATPLGPLAAGLPLAAFGPVDRLTEVEFELPLAGGDLAGGRPDDAWSARVGDVADLLARHLPEKHPLTAYPPVLSAGTDDGPLRGYLTGSLDAVLRVRGPDGPRYLVVDYKTNRLAPPGEPLTAAHYRPAALAEAMIAAHYPLQALLYLVALHRFLRWRQVDYDPGRQLGGAVYAFLRGMCGPQTPVAADGTPYGVFGWRPPAELVIELSALLDGRRPRRPRDAA